MKDVISTPFGDFKVKQNGEPIEFHYTIKNYSSNKTSTLIRLYVIEVDMQKENITCGFDKPIFKQQIKEAHSTTLFVENEELMLGLCGINPSNQILFTTTNNEYGFTYNIENKITLLLCCIEKNKFKNAKKVIEKAFLNEIKLVKNIKEIPIKRKGHKTIITFGLFLLLSLFYIVFAFLLIEYKIVADETLKRIGFGLAGVMMVSYALSSMSSPKKVRKKEKTKTTFFISFVLLAIMLTAVDLTIYMLLCGTDRVGNEIILAIGLIIISFVILCWFVSEYKLDTTNKKKEQNIKENEPINKLIFKEKEEPKKPNPIFLNFSECFPKSLKEEWFSLTRKLGIEDLKVSEQNTTYQLAKETITVPYRIELEEVDENLLTSKEKQMLYCIYTRHYNGYIREKYIKKILETELQEWEFPYILKLSEEYVYEIVAIIYSFLKNKKNDAIKEFAKKNKGQLCKSYSKMTSYWNEFYRERTFKFHNYVGRKLFRECFGYSRKYEKKKFKCACCENNTIEGYLINYYNEPCPVCYWKNNSEQNHNTEIIGVNKMTLKEAQENYKKVGAIAAEYKNLVRKPLEKEKRKINSEQVLKLLKLQLIRKGFNRKKDIISFYEYQNQYFRIKYENELFVVEKAKVKQEKEWKKCFEMKYEISNQILVEKIIDGILKDCKPKQAKKKTKLTKTEKDKIVTEEINSWNPLGLKKDGNLEDEYSLEIKKITTKLSKLKTEKELTEHIENVFHKLFGENLFQNKKNEILKVSKTIWKRINTK